MEDEIKEALSVLTKGYDDLSEDFVDKVKSMNLYSKTLVFYERIKILNIDGLDEQVNYYVRIIEGLRKLPSSEFASCLFVLEVYLFSSFFELVGAYVLKDATKAIINSSDVKELTGIYKELMQMEIINENFLFEPFDTSIIEKRKKDIPVLQGFIKSELDFKLKVEQTSGAEKEEEQHQHIFSNNGFKLFEYILNKCARPKDVRGHQADVIYYYHRLKAENYVHQPISAFLNWYWEYTNKEVYIQNKTLDEIKNVTKDNLFSNAFTWFKQQK